MRLTLELLASSCLLAGDASYAPTRGPGETPQRDYRGPIAVQSRAEPEPSVTPPETAGPRMPGPPGDEPPPGVAMSLPGNARGRQEARAWAEPQDGWLLVPRTILFVPRMVLWGLFWPVSKALNLVDDPVLARVRAVFFWTERQTLGWYPLLSFQSGYGFSFGARIFYDDLFGHGESIAVTSQGGGLYSQVHQLHFRGTRLGGYPVWLEMRGRFEVQPRLIFAGVGDPPEVSVGSERIAPTRGGVVTRYSQTRGLAALWLGYGFETRLARLRPAVGTLYNHRRFGPDRSRPAYLVTTDLDPSIEQVYETGSIPGFDDGVDVAQLLGSFEIDGRDRAGQPSRGFYTRIIGGGAPPQARSVAYLRYGAELSTYFDLFRRSRILVLRAALEAVHGESANIPFSELPRLGGPHRLRGYRLNHFRGPRILLFTAEYRYPIHQFVDGYLFVDVGRIGSDYEDLFAAGGRKWRVGYGGGFRFRTRRRLLLRIDFSYGEDFLVFFSTDALQAFTDEHLLEL